MRNIIKIRDDICKILILFFVAIFVVIIFQECNKDDSNPVGGSTSTTDDCPNGRKGAMCNDGTTSTATGSGACSHHGGVRYWLCN